MEDADVAWDHNLFRSTLTSKLFFNLVTVAIFSVGFKQTETAWALRYYRLLLHQTHVYVSDSKKQEKREKKRKKTQKTTTKQNKQKTPQILERGSTIHQVQ